MAGVPCECGGAVGHVMRKIMCVVVSVMVWGCLGQAPASASGTAEDGPVGIGVIGEGLKVREVRALLDGWQDGARAV
ncbi:hypothetical protein OKW18_000017 [Streptomyces pratensis]|nr:hypothetical protein [Streptomyces pratensis]